MNSVLFFQEFLNCESLFGGWLLLWVLGKPSADRLTGHSEEFRESASPSPLWFAPCASLREQSFNPLWHSLVIINRARNIHIVLALLSIR